MILATNFDLQGTQDYLHYFSVSGKSALTSQTRMAQSLKP